ncbi:MAG: MATE family efflux transporter [Bacteroidales bacterium]|nr:MATE family efflux transporter [Bacteroidales bacterium]MCM1148207.1 MATE family efflux transporter [Bacteroidales bacterium]MCM1207066.1 MATE family efflux transporter [Bacillota bacterium]
MTKDRLLEMVRDSTQTMTFRQKLMLVAMLSLPAMIAQLSSVVMQVIDASMLGHLGTHEAAAVGLMSTTIWLFGGVTSGLATGFYVQVAHRIGANDAKRARSIVKQGISCGLVFSCVMTLIGLVIAPCLPVWLGAAEAIRGNASLYFSVVVLAMPLLMMNNLAAGSLRCSGNVKTPSMLGVLMCVLDVLFNYLFIFVFGMGVLGAAVGTLLSYLVTMSLMMYCLVARDRNLRFSLDAVQKFRPHWDTLSNVMKIGTPISLERGVMSGAQVAISGIIAPMGSVAIAANTFGVNVESLCYMPGYGVAEAATTLVGQSMGARRQELMRSFAWISVLLGMAIMAVMGVVMWVFAPEMMSIVTSDADVIRLGTDVLRIEAWAEPGFAAAIVAYSVFVGAGRTMGSSVLNLVSIWGVRLTLALALAPSMGLHGVWIAMAVELTFRGIAFLLRLRFRLKIRENCRQA